MNFYDNELRALKRANRFRKRQVYPETYVDFASNDYLGLAHRKELLHATCQLLREHTVHAPKASMLVNGYHRIHQEFEQALCAANGFEAGIILGSGFNANMALIEALLRRGDTLLIDEKFHASGMLAARTIAADVVIFRHNSAEHLQQLLQASTSKRNVIVVEGVYSMQGDVLQREIITLADEYGALLIVDEAHSSGILGNHLMGVFDWYDITIAANHIKMGTLGKAYGSFGGYILASDHIVSYLINRAKPIIYATAPSLFDTLLAHQSLEYIQKNTSQLRDAIALRRAMVQEYLPIEMPSLIASIPLGDNKKVMALQAALLREGIVVGAIRPPTVEHAIIRLIARLGESEAMLKFTCKFVKNFQVK